MPKRLPAIRLRNLPERLHRAEVERLVNASGPTGGEVILRDGTQPKSVGIIHCVGSRDKKTNRLVFARLLHVFLKLAHLLREHTHAEIYNFYIDMRTPGKGYEEFYDNCSRRGNHFIRGRVGEVTDWAMLPEEEGKLVIRVEDTLAGVVRRIPVDMVVLATGLEPQKDAQDVRRLFNMSCGSEGFFLERHPKLAPVNTFTDGIYIAGCCQGPRDIPDTVAQAGAAAAEALALIDTGYVEQEPNTAYILPDCCGCKSCIPLCPYTAITYDETTLKAVINEALCKGCGTCVGSCPSGSIVQNLCSRTTRSSVKLQACWRLNRKSETRNPKSETNPNTEIREFETGRCAPKCKIQRECHRKAISDMTLKNELTSLPRTCAPSFDNCRKPWPTSRMPSRLCVRPAPWALTTSRQTSRSARRTSSCV
jgi:heterodisulfide reductase subunit A2